MRVAILVGRNLAEAQVVEMVSNQGILGSWNVLAANRRHAPIQGQATKVIEQKLLDATLEDPAAHQPRVDFEHPFRHPTKYHANQPIITKPIG